MSDEPFETTFHVGEIVRAAPFPETRKPEMAKLETDLDDDVVQSAAQTGYDYEPSEVESLVLSAVEVESLVDSPRLLLSLS